MAVELNHTIVPAHDRGTGRSLWQEVRSWQ